MKVTPEENTLPINNRNKPGPPPWRKSAVGILVIVLGIVAFAACGAILVGIKTASSSPSNSTPSGCKSKSYPSPKESSNSNLQNVTCHETCSWVEDQDRFGGDLLEHTELLRLVDTERGSLIKKLKEDYGEENYVNIFETAGMLFQPANPDGPSWDRLKRKMKMKILSMQIGIEQERQFREQCQCQDDSSITLLRNDTGTLPHYYSKGEEEFGTINEFPQVDLKGPFYARYVWVNGGDSAAAGHGNFFVQSYTSVMEQAVKGIFGAIGIDFVGKNYAMNATSSGEEIALCAHSIFGRDMDSLVWNFATSESINNHDDAWKLMLYAYQMASSPSRPALLGMLGPSDNSDSREKVLKAMEKLGMASLRMDNNFLDEMEPAIPDTSMKSVADIDAMPEFLRYLKCSDGCADRKFDLDGHCDNREGLEPYNLGWRIHALLGNSMALSIVEILRAALIELQSVTAGERQPLYGSLAAMEVAEYSGIFDVPVPKELEPEVDNIFDAGAISDIDKTALFKNRGFCHSALLPSEIRYQGILTESDKEGFFSYEKGRSDAVIRAFEMRNKTRSSKRKREMRLAYGQYSRRRNRCPSKHLKMDYHDFFYLSSYDQDWRYMTIPNEIETKHYALDTCQLEGLIMVCPSPCEDGICDAMDIQSQYTIDTAPIFWEVNGVPVSKLSKVNACYMLKGEEGHHWIPDSNGQFVIKARIEDSGYKFLKLSSFILL